MFEPPTGAIAGDLVRWREDGSRHTLVTIAGPLFMGRLAAREVTLRFALHDVTGAYVGSWDRPLRSSEEVVFVDSRKDLPRSRSSEGTLVVWACASGPTKGAPPTDLRLLSTIDWFSDEGELASLHNDQSIRIDSERNTPPIALTEIVFLETKKTRTSLVVVNGPEAQGQGALKLVLRNARGEERLVVYGPPMAPFSVHEVRLAELAPDLVAFCRGEEATVSGSFEARRVFTRPYVMTEGALTSAYHGGDRYEMRGIPRMVHRTVPHDDVARSAPLEALRVMAQKEMNPAYVVHGPELTTRIHLFQSHGDIDEDFAVDAMLYDREGRLVAHRERWAVAPRRGATTCEVRELLASTGRSEVEGHIALRFSDDPHELFPRRLQALMEFRAEKSVTRTMLWSDRWNAPDRLRRQRPYRAAYRVFMNGPRTTRLAITNPGVSPDYAEDAPFVVRLRVGDDELVYRGTLGPHATMVASIDELFPRRPRDELAFAIVESNYDLASIQLTRDIRSGVVAVEHLVPMIEQADGVWVIPSGS